MDVLEVEKGFMDKMPWKVAAKEREEAERVWQENAAKHQAEEEAKRARQEQEWQTHLQSLPTDQREDVEMRGPMQWRLSESMKPIIEQYQGQTAKSEDWFETIQKKTYAENLADVRGQDTHEMFPRITAAGRTAKDKWAEGKDKYQENLAEIQADEKPEMFPRATAAGQTVLPSVARGAKAAGKNALDVVAEPGHWMMERQLGPAGKRVKDAVTGSRPYQAVASTASATKDYVGDKARQAHEYGQEQMRNLSSDNWLAYQEKIQTENENRPEVYEGYKNWWNPLSTAGSTSGGTGKPTAEETAWATRANELDNMVGNASQHRMWVNELTGEVKEPGEPGTDGKIPEPWALESTSDAKQRLQEEQTAQYGTSPDPTTGQS